MTVLNWEFIQQYLPLYEKAAWLTLRLGVMGILLSIAVGLACAVIQYEKIPVLRRVAAVYIEISRNTPLLIQLFFLYYGLPKIGIRTSPAMCGVAGLAFLGGSYMAEAFRSGLEAVEPIQRESAFSLGMTRTQAMAYVVLPQAVSISVPAFQRRQPDGPDVHRQGPDRHVRQDHREPVSAGGVLSHHPAARVGGGDLDREGGALCRIWVLKSC